MLNYLKHLFVPHHTNNFRAKILQLDFFAIYIVILFSLSFGMKGLNRINPSVLGYATDIRTEQLLNLTNTKRLANGASVLNLNPQLSQAAAAKAADMFKFNYWAHNSPSGTTPWNFIKNIGYQYIVAGENLAKNFSDSNGVIEAWMNSPSHRENLLRQDYQDVGFAVVNGVLNGEETTLVVQMFGKPMKNQAARPTQEEIKPIALVPATSSVSALIASPLPETSSNPTPQPIAAQIVIYPTPVSEQVLNNFANGVVKQPIIDIRSTSKNIILSLMIIVLSAMAVDGLYIWRRKIVRVSGNNYAHMLFLFILTGLVWFASFGNIL